jgi:hypothetical protein
MTAAFRRYADRGVFRGFRATPGPRGRVEYQFQWLTRIPMHAQFSRGVLTFAAVLPQVSIQPRLGAELKQIAADRSSRAVPAHKRIDARRARLSASVRGGDFSLAIAVRGANHEYAVKQALNLINELFVFLHESHPGYLVEHFGISTE